MKEGASVGFLALRDGYVLKRSFHILKKEIFQKNNEKKFSIFVIILQYNDRQIYGTTIFTVSFCRDKPKSHRIKFSRSHIAHLVFSPVYDSIFISCVDTSVPSALAG